MVILGHCLAFAVFMTLTVATMTAVQPKDYAVRVAARVSATPTPSIVLTWDKHADQRSVIINRKLKTSSAFPETAIATLDSNATSWTDTTVEVGVSYEYRLVRDHIHTFKPDSVVRWWGFGYINTGIAVAPEMRGRVLVLVDSTLKGALAAELTQFTSDAENEGWDVSLLYVPRAETFNAGAVDTVRQTIRKEYAASKRSIKAVFLVGRVPVPYSGEIAPDGHTDHVGAWPADGIYGDDGGGSFQDGSVNRANNSRKAQENLPGDGKFDQSTFPSSLEFGVGRVDFYNLPVFEKSEVELLKAYFEKNHAFRTGVTKVVHNAYVDDNFGAYGEGFAASAWRNFPLFGGDTSVHAGDWFGSLAGPQVSLWGYGCGGGTDISCGGVGTSTDLATKPVNAIHTQLFGSYFGDWDTKNNFLRSAIASSPTALTCAWVGRPAWYTHHMALGATIGYSTMISQNNYSNSGGMLGVYVPNVVFSGTSAGIASIGERGVHIALMGDPTLRAFMPQVPPVLSAMAQSTNYNRIHVSWNAVNGADAYMVARKYGNKQWTFLTMHPIDSTSYTDSLLYDGAVEYRVYSCVLVTTPAGTYFDAGKPTATSLVVTGVDVLDPSATTQTHISPQPASTLATLRVTVPASSSTMHLTLVDLAGATVWELTKHDVSAGSFQVELPAHTLASGRYILHVESATGMVTMPYIVVH